MEIRLSEKTKNIVIIAERRFTDRIIGITNNAGKGRYVFFEEQDKIDFFTACEEANFISQVGGIDIDLLVSSQDEKDPEISNYHFVSYDVITKQALKSLQRLRFECDHYPDIEELALSRIKTEYCRLRLGTKGKKDRPYFVKRFECQDNKHYKSRSHVWLYQLFCKCPQVTSPTRKVISQSKILCVYTIGKKREDKLLIRAISIFKKDNRHHTKKRNTYK